MRPFVHSLVSLVVLAVVLSTHPVSAGVAISIAITDGSTRLSSVGGFVPMCPWVRPVTLSCHPVIPVYLPSGYPCGQFIYVPQAAMTGWTGGPPVVVTSPPSLYGFGSPTGTATTNTRGWNRNSSTNTQNTAVYSGSVSTADQPVQQDTPSFPKDPLLVERLDVNRVLLTWNEDSTRITSVLFCAADLHQSPLNLLRVSQRPFRAVLTTGGSTRYLGATVFFGDGTNTTRWVPCTVLTR